MDPLLLEGYDYSSDALLEARGDLDGNKQPDEPDTPEQEHGGEALIAL